MTSLAPSSLAHLISAGAARAWQWWTSELAAAFLPLFSVLGARDRIVLDIGNDDMELFRLTNRGRVIKQKHIANLSPHAGADDSQWRKTRKKLGRTKQLQVWLSPSHVLQRQIAVPLAAETNLRKVVELQLDRLFPLPSESLIFDVAVIDRDKSSHTLTVEVAVIEKDIYFEILSIAEHLNVAVKRIALRAQKSEDDGQFSLDDLYFNFREPSKGAISEDQRLLVLLAGLACLLCYVFSTVSTAHYQDHVRHLSSLNVAMDVDTSEFSALRQDVERFRTLYSRLSEKSRQPSVSKWLAELTNIMPKTAYLTELSFSGSTITLKGYAEKPETLKKQLARSTFFEVEQVKSISRKADEKPAFSAVMNIHGGSDGGS